MAYDVFAYADKDSTSFISFVFQTSHLSNLVNESANKKL